MAQDKVLKCLGLVNQYSPLSIAPGALLRANDCMIRRENIVEDRRGHNLYATMANNIKQVMSYQDKVLVHHGSTISYDDGSGTFADYSGTYSEVPGSKIRSLEAFSNLYFTTSLGVQVLTDVAGTEARYAGAPRALDPSYALSGTVGFLDDGKQCAYRCTIRRTDANQNVIMGYPSQRLWVVNGSGNAANVELTVYLPDECIVGDVIQFYRTAQFTGTSDDISGDEMGLVYQYELTSGDITNGYITFIDSVTDALRGATLYTSPSQEGIAQANDRPPLCKDLALYKSNYMLYANTQTKQRLFVTLVGAGALGFQTTADTTDTSDQLENVAVTTNIAVGWKVEGAGIPEGTTVVGISGSTVTLSQAATVTDTGVTVSFYTNETITLGGVTYSFGSSEIISGAGSPQVKVSVTGVAAVDIDETARSLVKVINRCASNTTVYAYYLTGPDDLPGQMMIEEKGIGASAFTLQSSNATLSTMFFPAPPVSPDTSAKSTSSNQIEKNAIYFSKAQQPEHVPLLNKLLIGPANREILRVIALRDSAIIIKEEGVYRLTGETPQSFSVVPVDLTVFCKSANSVVALANQVFMLSNQGVVAISESGVQVVSREIEPSLAPLLTVSSVGDYTAGIAYESERSFFLSTITEPTDTAPNQTFVYNIFTRTWVRHTYAFVAGLVEDSIDKMFFAKPSDSRLFKERKDFTNEDFADPDVSITITAISGATVDFTIAGATPQVGWVIKQGTTEIAIDTLTMIPGGYRAVLAESPPDNWETGAATALPSVGMDIEWHSWSAQAPDRLKQVWQVGILADDIPGNNTVSQLTATFRTNFDDELESVDIDQPGQGWGAAWGQTPWGGTGDSLGYPTYVPRNKQYCTRMNLGVRHKRARERLSIAGYCVSFNAVSERISR